MLKLIKFSAIAFLLFTAISAADAETVQTGTVEENKTKYAAFKNFLNVTIFGSILAVILFLAEPIKALFNSIKKKFTSEKTQENIQMENVTDGNGSEPGRADNAGNEVNAGNADIKSQ